MQNCYFLLSTLYAHNSDFEIDLYTDYDFGQLLEKAPYKNINIVFEEKDYSKINPLVWAWPKFVALDMVSRDTIHIDGDVFLKDNSCNLYFGNDDAICQHLEKDYHCKNYLNIWKKSYNSIEHLDWPAQITKGIPSCMPNNGILGIKNESLWKTYRDSYWHMCNQCGPRSVRNVGYCVPDLIFEQYFLKQICDKLGYKLGYFLDGDNSFELHNDAVKKSYQHVCSGKIADLQKCINLIKKKNIACYDMLKSNWGSLYPEYFEIL